MGEGVGAMGGRDWGWGPLYLGPRTRAVSREFAFGQFFVE